MRRGRHRLYGFNLTGFMDQAQAEWFFHDALTRFLREAPKLTEEYGKSMDSMTLFWEQASSALVLSLERVICAAQSVSFAQAHNRVSPSIQVARQQADVLTEVFVKPWVSDLIASLHPFLENERRMNASVPRIANSGPPGRPGRLAAPSSMEALRRGWEWASGPEGAGHKLWISRMKGKEAGPWGEFLDRAQREQDEHLKRMAAEVAPASQTS